MNDRSTRDYQVDVRGLSIAAGATPILRGVDLSVRRGEVVGIIGESGAGKSTLGLAALGFLRPGSRVAGGGVSHNGVDILSLDDQARRQLRLETSAYVAQSAMATFNPAFPLGWQVTEIARLRGLVSGNEAADYASNLFAQLDLPEPAAFVRRYPHQVSGGQLQRAMIAMALAGKPKFVVFDEPTTALDATTQLDVVRCIKDLVQTADFGALYVSHDIAIVSQIADRIVVMRNGEVVEANTSRALFSAPRSDYVRALIDHRRTSEAPPVVSAAAGPLLSVERVSARYGAVQVLKDVSFTLQEGGVTALVGESGSGKSTTAKVILGLVTPLNGEVRFCGEVLPDRLSQRNADTLKRIQLIHQQPDVSLNPRQTISRIVGRPVTVFEGLRGAALEARLVELMRQVELPPHLLDHYPGRLSGGQKQRVAIARALAARPQVLICDEITSALDPLIEESIVALLARLRADSRMGILFISHDLSLVRRIAEQVVVMKHGHIAEAGSTRSVFDDPRDAYTRRLLEAMPSVDGDWLGKPASTATV